jgi:CRP-like cAMP-binding protein
LPHNLSNFISLRFKHNDNLVTLEPFQLKKLITNKFLNTLFDDEFIKLLSYLEPVVFSAGEFINQADKPFEYVYFPENAVFSQLNIAEDGQMCEIAMIGKEGVVGFSTVLDSSPPRFWTQISAAGTALKIRADIFRQEFNDNKLIQIALFNYMNSFISQISQKTVCNNHHILEERFCTWFLMFHDRCSRNELRLTQEEIAMYLGVNRPSVTQLTQSLRKKEIIDYVRGKILIINRDELENLACVCYSAVNNTSVFSNTF